MDKEKDIPYYDDYDAVDFIHKETGISRRIIRTILNSDLRYQRSVGIIDWDYLDEYIKDTETDSYFDD